jgi:hypothetical protein
MRASQYDALLPEAAFILPLTWHVPRTQKLPPDDVFAQMGTRKHRGGCKKPGRLAIDRAFAGGAARDLAAVCDARFNPVNSVRLY